MDPKIFMIGNAHLDPAWLWRWQEGYAEIKATFRSALDRMKEFDGYIFTAAGAGYYQWVEENEPAMFEEIRQRVAEGRWELTASAWVETDKNMANGESLSRHILYAKNYLSKIFSVDPDSLEVDFDPDTFGHSRNVPEISSEGGVKYYYHCRGRVGEQILNRWRASSGAELIFIEFPDYSTRDERRQLITHELIKRDLGHLPPCFLVVSNGEADLLA